LKKPATFSGSGLNSCDDEHKPVICPTGQASKYRRLKKPATFSGGGLNSCDDEHKPVICPTGQASKNPSLKKPAAFSGCGLNSCDDEHKPVICPQDQVVEKSDDGLRANLFNNDHIVVTCSSWHVFIDP
jgi:hypothetical protein